MYSRCPHHDLTLVVQNIRSLDNLQNQQKPGPSEISQLQNAEKRVSLPVRESDCSEGGSSVPSTIQGQNSTRPSWFNSSRVGDFNEWVTSNPSDSRRRWINTPTSTPGTHSCSSPAPGGTSTFRIVSSPTSGIVITPTPLTGLENLPTLIPNPEAHTIITNPLQLGATGKYQRPRQGNCNCRGCQHLDQWSPAVLASINLFTQTYRILCLHRVDS
jgi:hypothetical protein